MPYYLGKGLQQVLFIERISGGFLFHLRLGKASCGRKANKKQCWSQEGLSPYKTSKLLMTFSGTNFLLCGTAHKTMLFSSIKG